MELSFKSRKLKNLIKRITDKAKNFDLDLDSLSVYGVSKEEGVIVTGREVGKNLSEYFYFSGQKIAYNPYRANIGSIGLTDHDFKGLMSPAYVIFGVDETIYPEFLLLYLKSNIGLELIRWYGDRGGVRSSLRISDLSKIDFPDISYYEQKEFHDDYIEKKKNVDKLLKEFNKQESYLINLRKSILQDAISGKLSEDWRLQNKGYKSLNKLLKADVKNNTDTDLFNEARSNYPFKIPESWRWVKLGDLTEIQNGYAFKSSNFSSEGIRLLRNINISNGKIDWSNTVYYSHKDVENLDRFRLYVNDIVISLDRPLISTGLKISIIKENDLPAMLLQRVGRIQYSELKINNIFLYHWLNSNYFISNLSIGESIGIPHISTKDLENMKFPLPPLEEQKVIVDIVNDLLLFCNKSQQQVDNCKKDLDNLLQSFINNFFRNFNIINISRASKVSSEIFFNRIVKYNSKTTFMELVDLLKEHGKLHAEDLWKMSKYFDNKNIGDSIDKFYADLKKKIEVDKAIKEVENEKGYLELV